MGREQWRYYNHALVATVQPHECVDENIFKNSDIWKGWNGSPLLARWTSEFDCGYETSFWYIIKDDVFSLENLKAKRRYEITKGNRNFECKIIDPVVYAEDIFEVWSAALQMYDSSYRPEVEHDTFIQWIKELTREVFYGAFERESGRLCGVAILSNGKKQRYFSALKVVPEMEKKGINAAMVYSILENNKEFLNTGGYICDGTRSIYHPTNFQDYLEKYFGFRKAYCMLNVKYPWYMGVCVKILFLMRKLMFRWDHVALIHKINGVLKIEEIRRECEKDKKLKGN